jgi:integrase
MPPVDRRWIRIMGWSSTAMAARYQHVTDPIRRDVADRLGGLLWAKRKEADDAN